MLGADLLLDLLPLDAERRVGQQVVERRVGQAVLGERVAVEDARGVLAFQHHVGAAHRVRLGVQLLAEHLELGAGVEIAEVVLRDAQHPAGAARGVVERGDRALLRQQVVVVGEQDVHHQADDLARGEVLAGGLVRQLGELAHQLLVDVAHLEVRDALRVKVEVAELRDDLVEQVRALQTADLRLELELRDHVPRARVESEDVAAEVLAHVRGVVEQRRERERRGVVEAVPGDLHEHRVHVLQAALELLMALQHLRLRRLEHRVEAAENGEREDDLAVLGLLVVPAQQVGDRPDEGDLLLEAVHALVLPGSVCEVPHYTERHRRGSSPLSAVAGTLAASSSTRRRGHAWVFACGVWSRTG